METIYIAKEAGIFAENKDVARSLRIKKIMPELKKEKGKIILDFKDVTGATQSFIHALISELIRQYGDSIFDRIEFRHCSQAVRQVISIVAEYMQES